MGRDVDQLDEDAEWNRRERNETPTERLDRNWADLLQELRVVQTGVQLLTGLLLTVPFQAQFAQLSSTQRTVYLVTLSFSAVATALLIAPVSMHRVLFRQHARRPLIRASQRFALVGLAMLALAVTGVMLLIFDVVLGWTAGLVAGICTLIVFAGLWGLVPLMHRFRSSSDEPAQADAGDSAPTGR